MGFKVCEIVSNLVNKETGEPYIASIEEIKEICEKEKVIRDYYVFLHDKDEGKANHVHIYLRFGNSNLSAENIAKKFHTLPQNVNHIKSTFAEAVVYGLHLNAPEKYQYDSSAIICSSEDIELQIRKAKQKKKNRVSQEQISIWLEQIKNGEIREYNKTEYIPFETLVNRKSIFDNAFKLRTEILEGKADRDMKVFYLVGDSECYKTTYAKKVCEDNKWSYYISSGSNDVLDGYKGQDALILDDLRPSCVGLVDLLKLLDNHTSSSVKSRYKNKVLECKAIFITTTKPIETFFASVFEHEQEPLKQLCRRCGTYLWFHDDMIQVKMYDKLKGDYVYVTDAKNPAINMYPKKSLTKEDMMEQLNMLGLNNEDIQIADEDGFISVNENDNVFEQMNLDDTNK